MLFSPCVVITACMPDKPRVQKWFNRRPSDTQALMVIQQQVMSVMRPSLLMSAAVNYPWCFVAPAMMTKRKHYFVGAFLPWQDTGTQLVVLYVLVSDSWLEGNMNKQETLPFWLARVLATLLTDNTAASRFDDVREWCRILQRTLIPKRWRWGGDSNTWLLQQMERLCGEICDADFEFSSRDGVDAMPWMGWPGCVQNDENIWLWRQSRYGKVIESQKIALMNKRTNKV